MGSSGHPIEPPMGAPLGLLPTDGLASNVAPPAEASSLSLFEGSKGFVIHDFTVNTIGRDATFTNVFGSVRCFVVCKVELF